MAEQDLGLVFNNLAFQLQGLSNKLSVQSINQVVPKFSGDTSKFRTWIKQIEKYVLLSSMGRDEAKMVAYQASDPPVSDFIHRWLEANEDLGWNELKAQLTARFAEVIDSQHAFELLSKIKQKPGENVPIFAERLYNLAAEVFRDQNVMLPIIQSQLVNFFINGLSLDYLKMKIMRDNPQTFQQAVAVAMTEQNLRKRFELRKGGSDRSDLRPSGAASHEPMEVDHYRSHKRCLNCNKFGHKAKDCRVRVKQVNVLYKTDQSEPKEQIECWRCGKKGHIKRNCHVKLPISQDRQVQGN